MHRALLSFAAAAAILFPAVSFAAPTINDATVNGGASVTVFPGDSVTIEVSGAGDGNPWQSTSWLIDTSPLGSSACVDTTDDIGSQTVSFSATAPGTEDTYNLYIQAFADADDCSGDASSVFELTGAVIVSAGATFTEVSGRTWFDADEDGSRVVGAGSCSGTADDCVAGTEVDLSDITVTAAPVLDAAGTDDPSRTASTSITNGSGGYFFYFDTVDVGRWRISATLPSGWSQTHPTTTDLFYDITVNDADNTGSSVTRENYTSGTDFNFGLFDSSLVPATPLATPTSTPETTAGPFSAAQNVELGTASSSATTTSIYFTTDGTDPACPATGTLYSGPIALSLSTAIRAIACSEASSSTVAVLEFSFNLPPEAPDASPATTTAYTSAQDITLTSASTTANIYYTTDGTDPICGVASLYSSPFTLSSDTTVKAVACGSATSSVAAFAYDIDIPAPAPSGGGSSGSGSGSSNQNANGPISTNVPVNAPPPSSGGGSSFGNAVIPTVPAQSGTVLGTQTVPAEESAPAPALSAEEPAEATVIENGPTTTPITQAAAVGLLGEGIPWWQIAALILAILLVLWGLWSWTKTGTSH